ncbi:hypothetical protein Scep_027927 [Stephania cephalantha]|uniref:DUF4283 domain-containing protein n=1 Tax=Stephania cephalantha TaxID=152367 RepID=A0AAP0HN01_9MAGN
MAELPETKRWTEVVRRTRKNADNGTYARKDEGRLETCNWRRFWAEKKRFTITFDSNGITHIQEATFGRSYSLNLDQRESSWVQRVIIGALESKQWIQRWFKSREGPLYIQTMENHLGAVMRIWRVGRTGRNTILIPSEGMNGWTALLQALQREPQMQASYTKTSTQEAYNGQKEAQTIAHPMKKAPKAQSRNEEVPAEWQLAMVVVRSTPIHPWSMIGYMLGAGLQRGATLHPLGADKALFYCVSSQEKEKMISKGKSMGGILIDRIEGWSPTQHSSHQISCHDTWIRLEGLPINLWNMHTYQSIGSHFGGLVEVASTTERKAYEHGSWIRVAGDINRFFPGKIEVPCWGTKVPITIITSVSGKKNGEDEADVDPKDDVADLEKLQQGGIADKEDGLEPAISAATGASTGDTINNDQGVRTAPNSSRDGGHQNAINIRDVQLVPISRNSNTHQDQGKGKKIFIHPTQHETSSTMGTTRLLKGLVLDGPNMCLGSPSSSHETWTPTIKNNKTGPSSTNREVLQAGPLVVDLGPESSQEGQTPTRAHLTDIRPVQDRAREDIIQDLQRGRLALSQGQIQGEDTPHPV